jgi:hypothetical protein
MSSDSSEPQLALTTSLNPNLRLGHKAYMHVIPNPAKLTRTPPHPASRHTILHAPFDLASEIQSGKTVPGRMQV